GVDGPHDQVGAVIGNHDLHAWRQPLLQLFYFVLDAVNDVVSIFPVAHDHNAAHGFTLAVHVEHAAPDGTPHLHCPQVPEVNRRAAHVGRHDDVLQVGLGFHIAAATDQILGIALLDQLAADILVGDLDRIHDLGDLDVVGEELCRVEVDLVFTHQAAYGGYLGHPLDGVELVAHEPVLQGAQLLQVVPFAFDGVPEDMTDTGAIRTKGWDHTGRKQGGCVVQPFENAGPCPVDICLVLKNDIDH